MIAPPKPPANDELEALIKEARERQLRRRVLGAAGVAVAAAVGLSIYAFVSGGTVRTVSRPPVRGHRASPPLCDSSQLSATAGFQGATQTMLGDVTLQNMSAGACSLPAGRPRVTISWRDKQLETLERGMSTAPPWPHAHVLAPGGNADVFFQWWSCTGSAPKAAVRPTFALRFGHGLFVTARSNNVTPSFCGGLGSPRPLDVSPALVSR
jgi:Protein of unknown function (DUF4232)